MTKKSFVVSVPESAFDIMAEARKLVSNEPVVSVIKTQDDYDYFGGLLKQLKERMRELDKLRKTVTEPLDQAKKAVIAEFKPMEQECIDIESGIKRAMSDYLREQDRLRRLAQAEAEEKARKERARLEERARKAAEAGKDEKAQELAATADSVQAAPVQQQAKTAGVAAAKTYKVEVTDMKAFVAAAMQNPMLFKCLTVDQAQLNRLAKAMGSEWEVDGTVLKEDFNIRA